MGITFDRNYYDDKSLSLSEPLTHARIGYQNIVTPDNIIPSTQVAGFEADAMGEPDTYQLWRPVNLPATVTIDAGEQVAVDYFALGAHNLSGCEVTFSHSPTGAEYTEARTAILPKNEAAMLLFEPVTARFFRLEILGWATEPTLTLNFAENEYSAGDYTSTGSASLGVLYVGKALAMQRGIYQGHQPVTLNRQSETRPTRSEGGQWLGRSVIRRGYTVSYQWSNLSALWYRDNFDPFVESAITTPFFVAWRPDGYADECVYGWTDGDVSPSNSGPRDLMNVTLTVKGHGNG